MSKVIAQKKNIINKIRAWTSLKDAPDPDVGLALYDDAIKSNDPIDFIVYLIMDVAGLNKLKLTVGTFLKTQTGEVDNRAKNSISHHSTYAGSNQELPSDKKNFTIPVRKIDQGGKYQISPNSQQGYGLYPSDTNSFHHKLYRVVSLAETQIVGSMTFSCVDGENLNITLTGSSFESVKNNFLSAITLFDQKMFVGQLMNTLFGKSKGSFNHTLEEEFEHQVYRNLLQDKGDQSFILTEEEMEAARKRAEERFNGKYLLDLSCGNFETNISDADINSLINSLGADSEGVSDELDKTFDKSVKNLGQNDGAAREGFFKRLLELIKLLILSVIFSSPEIRLLLMIMKAIRSGETQLTGEDSVVEMLKENKNIVKCIVEAMMDMFSDFLLEMIKTELRKLAMAAMLKIVQRQLRSRIEQLQSLINPL